MDDLITGRAGVHDCLYKQLDWKQYSCREHACEGVLVIHCSTNYPKLHVLKQNLLLGGLWSGTQWGFESPLVLSSQRAVIQLSSKTAVTLRHGF